MSELLPWQVRFRENRQQFQDYLPLTQRVQADLKEDASELASQEGWDLATQRGVSAWIDDQDAVFRFLRRNSFNEAKTYSVLLSALHNRAAHTLHIPVPEVLPYSSSPLFHVLPLATYIDRVGRPIVVITPREVRRDDNGSLDELVHWVWWSSEMLRRALNDYWSMRRWNTEYKGYGGEGCVAIVDASGAGYRNMEVELMPTIANVGSKNFPGMIEAIYVVNAGWTQRSLWSVISKVLPRTALERVQFADKPQQLAEVFDLDKLPRLYGGNREWDFNPSRDPVFQYYHSHAIGVLPEPVRLPPRNTSFASTAEVFYTADNTPATSTVTSRRPSVSDADFRQVEQLRMTRHRIDLPSPSFASPMDEQGHPFSGQNTPPLQVTSSAILSDQRNLAPLQRISSLADFKLYLSPSRMAQVDLITNDDYTPPTPKQPVRRQLRPALLENRLSFQPETLAARRARPPLPFLVVPGQCDKPQHLQRSYSDQLIRHHAGELEKLDGISPSKLREQISRVSLLSTSTDAATPELSSGEDLQSMQSPPPVPQEISAFSRSINPWYGYPVVRVPDAQHPGSSTVRPRYERNRKRDLVKTLLFLFLLRLQAWRDSFERTLGLNRLGPWVGFRHTWEKASNPQEGLLRTAEYDQHLRGREVVAKRKNWEGDWLWMLVGFMLMRGTWTRLVAIPLEAMGLERVRDLLGLA